MASYSRFWKCLSFSLVFSIIFLLKLSNEIANFSLMLLKICMFVSWMQYSLISLRVLQIVFFLSIIFLFLCFFHGLCFLSGFLFCCCFFVCLDSVCHIGSSPHILCTHGCSWLSIYIEELDVSLVIFKLYMSGRDLCTSTIHCRAIELQKRMLVFLICWPFWPWADHHSKSTL